MLKPEYDEIFQSIYNKAAQSNSEIKNVLIIYNTNSKEGVSVAKGTEEDEGTYRISCEGNDSDPDYTISSFALGLALVIYDIKYGEYDYNNMSDQEKTKFDKLLHEFFPESLTSSDISIH